MKISVIIPTNQSPVQSLEWSLLSLLANSDLTQIDQIIVSINGADRRTGNPSLQDEKEALCHKLSDMGYPITVLRSWSRCGQAEAIQIALALVKTPYYLLMHDDVVVLSKEWQAEAEQIKTHRAVVFPPILSQKLVTAPYNTFGQTQKDTTITYLPAINTTFSLFRTEDNLVWQYYLCNVKGMDVDVSSINDFYRGHPDKFTLLADDKFAENVEKLTRLEGFTNFKSPEVVQFSCGSWAEYSLVDDNVATFGPVAHHLEAMSSKESSFWEVKYPDTITKDTVRKLPIQLRELAQPVYDIPSLDGLRPLVCVLTYDRIDTTKYWLDAWEKCEKYGSKLLLVQNVDGTSTQDIADLAKDRTDYFLLRKNDKNSIRHWWELLYLKFDYDWDVICFFTDDCIPLRKDFLMPLLLPFTQEGIGLVGGYPTDKHYRSICIATKKDVLKAIEKHAERLEETYKKFLGAFSDYGEISLHEWVRQVGYKTVKTSYEWSLIFGWDSDHQGINDLWEKGRFNIHGHSHNTNV